jgi:hypothetical protein
MYETSYKPEKSYTFKFPSIEEELGEIERVAELFYQDDDLVRFRELFVEKAKNSVLSELSEEDWQKLENTDSFDIGIGDWDSIEEHIAYTNQETGANRNWQTLKPKMENGEELDAPIILKYEGKLHLVSGNTRLMVARALGVVPQVLIVEI